MLKVPLGYVFSLVLGLLTVTWNGAGAAPANLVGNPSGEGGSAAGWHLAFGGREASITSVRENAEAGAGGGSGSGWWLRYRSNLREPIGSWVQYNLAVEAGRIYTCAFEAKGSGTIYANAYDGLIDVPSAPQALSETPVTFRVTFMAAKPTNNQIQVRYRTPPIDVYFRNVTCAEDDGSDQAGIALSKVEAPPPEGLYWPESRAFPAFQPVQELESVVALSMGFDERIALSTLQGLINRPRPRIYVFENTDDIFWSRNALPGVTLRPLAVPPGEGDRGILAALLRRYPDAVRGLVIYDPAVPSSIDIGTSLAGIERAMLVSPELAAVFTGEPFHLAVVADLRQHGWKSKAEAYEWAFEHVWSRTQHRLLFSLDPRIPGNLREYAVATRGFVFWLDPTLFDEKLLLARILAASPPNRPVLGWWTDEPAGVMLGSMNARYTIASDFCNNLSVFGAFPLSPEGLRQAPAAPLPPLAPRVYFSVILSDGDNLQFMQHRLRAIWEAPGRPDVPVAYTIQPWAGEAIPSILEYYYRTATAANLFVAGPSGPGYAYPAYWPADQLAAWLGLSAPLVERVDVRWHEIWQYGDARSPALEAYARALQPDALLLGNGGNGNIYPFAGTIAVVNVGQAESIDQAVQLLAPFGRRAAGGPVFVSLYADAWKFDASWVDAVQKRLGPEFQLVRIDQLIALWRQAHGANE